MDISRKDSPAQRFLALWFPYLQAERLLRLRFGASWRSRAPQTPLLFSRREGNMQRVAAMDARAEALGLRLGLGVAEARAIHPAAEVVPHDREADRRFLVALADWCDRYTPLVAIDAEDGLFLDVTGCTHLFGGEQAMLNEVMAHFRGFGLDIRAAIASTPGAAWACTRYASGMIIEKGAEAAVIRAMPLAALRLEAASRANLESVGLRNVGALIDTPRAPLARRFGKAVLLRLDQALGHVEEAISPHISPPLLSVERRFFEPICQMTDIEALVPVLARRLKCDLEGREQGARHMELQLFRVDGAVTRLAIRSSRPLREPEPIQRLFREKINSTSGTIDCGYGFDLIRMAILAAEPLPPQQIVLDDTGGTTDIDVDLFADRVRTRYGKDAIAIPRVAASHVPERALGAVATAPYDPNVGLPQVRPIRLLVTPECIEVAAAEIPEGPPGRFRWRNVSYRVRAAEGPERIAPEWWRQAATPGVDIEAAPKTDTPRDNGHGVSKAGVREDKEKAPPAPLLLMHEAALAGMRDYFRVEDDAGRRYWIFRQGGYANSEHPTRWFMQGLFA